MFDRRNKNMEKNNCESKNKHVLRIDLIQETVSIHERKDGSIIIEQQMKLDPKKYETIEINGETAFKDKFTGIVIPESVLEKMCSKIGHGIPGFYTPPKQLDYCAYLKKAKAELLKHWNEKYLLTNMQRPFDKFLSKLKGKETRVVILYVDMEGSTRISSEVDSETNLKIVKIFLMQMAKVIDNFRGYVFKFLGDCVIGVFLSDENITNMSDNAIQAAVIMRSVVEDVINPVFDEKGLPQIGYHIGLDIGYVNVDNIGALDVAVFYDLIGYSMNLTAKIQSLAGHNEILIGKNLYELLNCDLQGYCEKMDIGRTLKMKNNIDGSK